MSDENLNELIVALRFAKYGLRQLKQRINLIWEEDDCTQCFRQGLEDAIEPYEDFVESVELILKQHDIDSNFNSSHKVTSKQMKLNERE